MTVEQCVIVKQSDGTVSITDRVQVPCELVEAADGDFLLVRLLAPGPGLETGTEITVPAVKVTP